MRFKFQTVACLAAALSLSTSNILAQECARDAQGVINSTGLSGTVSSLTVLNDGMGQALYAVHETGALGNNDRPSRISKWNGRQWTSLGSFANGYLRDLTAFDDGRGTALYVVHHELQSNEWHASVARWDGSQWSVLPSSHSDVLHDLLIFDDGTGPGLFAVGWTATAPGVQRSRVVRWTGGEWVPVGDPLVGEFHELIALDDGSGGDPSLHAQGTLPGTDQRNLERISRWNGTNWSDPVQSQVGFIRQTMTFDDGTGATQLATGRLVEPSGPLGIYRREDKGWSLLGGGEGKGGCHAVNRMVTVRENPSDPPVLYVSGSFTEIGGVPANNIAKWDGARWVALGAGVGGDFTAPDDIIVFDDGSGPTLIIAETLRIEGREIGRVVKWNGSEWIPMGGDMDSTIIDLAIFDDGTGAALYAGGAFTSSGGIEARFVARWNGEGWQPLVERPAVCGPKTAIGGAPGGPIEAEASGIHHGGHGDRGRPHDE